MGYFIKTLSFNVLFRNHSHLLRLNLNVDVEETAKEVLWICEVSAKVVVRKCEGSAYEVSRKCLESSQDVQR